MSLQRIRMMAALTLGMMLPLTAGAIDMIDLHENNVSGVPTLLSQAVAITGVVTAPNYLFSDYHLEIYVQDATAGQYIWVSGGASSYNADMGDSVTITGRVDQYNGMTEVGTSTSEFMLVNHGPATASPLPLTITCAELNNTFQPDYSEPNEGRLIRLDNCSITSGSWPVTVQGSNIILSVHDGSGTGTLYIDMDTTVNGSPHPGTGFSVVGVLKQYDFNSPYTTGYEIIPRFVGDIIPAGSGPEIVDVPLVRDVTPTSVTVLYETWTPGSSEVEYGLDDTYGLTAGDPETRVTQHSVPLSGLSPNTLYHFRVKTSNDEGTTYSNDRLLVTASDLPGQIHIAMSFSADHSYAGGGEFDPVPDYQILSARLVDLIEEAEYSVDAALYSFSLDHVRDALVDAHNRGALVRIIIDQNNSSADAEYCASFGIPYIDSSFGGNHGPGDGPGIMHNKFVVIDGRDTDPSNDWVFTGSANMSIFGSDDVNNALWIQDYGLARAYTLEFDEMWGSDTQIANAANAKMGRHKSDNTPHEFTINGLRIEQYMSPSDGVEDQILEAIATADQAVYFAILAFTKDAIADAMKIWRSGQIGRSVRGVFQQDQGICGEGSEYYAMAGDPCDPDYWAPAGDVWLDTALPLDRLLHHKYMIIDPPVSSTSLRQMESGDLGIRNGGLDPRVITGSYNWSYSAEQYHDENTIVVHSGNVANQYLQEFAERYHESGGTADLGIVTGVSDLESSALPVRVISDATAFPNPFNPQTSIAFRTHETSLVTVKIFDARGQSMGALISDERWKAGYHVLGWDGRDDLGRSLPSGVYFARVSAYPLTAEAEQSEVVRMMLLK